MALQLHDFPDDLKYRLKIQALKRRISLRSVVIHALTREADRLESLPVLPTDCGQVSKK